MSSTWLTRLAANDGHRPRLYFTIQGVPHVFQEDSTAIPSTLEAAARPRLKNVDKIDISPSKLNISRRRIEGGSVTITLHEDEAGTLAALFAPRRRRTTYLTANESSSDATLSVKAVTGLDDTVYIDAETVTFSGTGAGPTLTGCTRGAYDSKAQAHFGDATTGSGVFTTPPWWKGRRLYLKSYWLNETGGTTAALCRAEGTYRIESPPRFTTDGTWEISCAELSDEIFSKKFGTGLHEVELTEQNVAGDSARLQIVVGAGEPYTQFVVGDVATYVLARTLDDTFLCSELLEQLDDAYDDSILVATQTIAPPFPMVAAGGSSVSVQAKSVRHIAVLTDTAASTALMVLTSRLGDLANGDNDRLPGIERPGLGQPFWRMGAGIDEAEIDVGAFTSVGESTGGWSFVIDDESTVADFLFEFCLHTGSVAYITRDGLLSVLLLSETGNDSAMTIDDDMIAGDDEPEVTYDEGAVYPRVSLLCNYDPLSREFVGQINHYDAELAARYDGSDNALELSSKSIVVAGYPAGKVRNSSGSIQALTRPALSQSDLDGRLDRIQIASGRGDGYVSMRCHLPVMKLELGSVVKLTVDVPDLEGNAAVSAKLCRVTSLGPRWDDGEVDVVVQMLERLYVVAPACRIGAAAGAIMVLVNGNFEADTGAPGALYAIGQAVQVWDVSAGVMEQHTIVDADSTSVTLDGTPGFTIQANVDFIRPDNQALASTDESATGFTGFDYIYQIRDDENDTDIVEVTRWR